MTQSTKQLNVPRIRLISQVLAHDDAAWEQAGRVDVDWFHPRSSGHHPKVQARLMHDGAHLHVQFEVHDRYVRSVITETNGGVCGDSCVEFFVEPIAGGGYFNFEINAGGTLLTHYNVGSDKTRKITRLNPQVLKQVQIRGTMPRVIDPEITEPTTWFITALIPISLMSEHLGREVPLRGTWRGNFYKCADLTSHPHWAAWSPVGEVLSFHQPERFGELIMAE